MRDPKHEMIQFSAYFGAIADSSLRKKALHFSGRRGFERMNQKSVLLHDLIAE